MAFLRLGCGGQQLSKLRCCASEVYGTFPEVAFMFCWSCQRKCYPLAALTSGCASSCQWYAPGGQTRLRIQGRDSTANSEAFRTVTALALAFYGPTHLTCKSKAATFRKLREPKYEKTLAQCLAGSQEHQSVRVAFWYCSDCAGGHLSIRTQ